LKKNSILSEGYAISIKSMETVIKRKITKNDPDTITTFSVNVPIKNVKRHLVTSCKVSHFIFAFNFKCIAVIK
jgi:hypothetical protein